MTDYGLDVGGAFDLAPTFATLSGPVAVAACVARRFVTPRGSLRYDPDFGFDVRDLLSAALSPTQLAALPRQLSLEAEKDERVASANVRLTVDKDSLRLSVHLGLRDSGVFRFVLRIDRVSAVLSEE